MSSDPFANTTTVKNILQHVLSPKIVNDGNGGFRTATDLVNIDTVKARRLELIVSGNGTAGNPFTGQSGVATVVTGNNSVTFHHTSTTTSSVIIATSTNVLNPVYAVTTPYAGTVNIRVSPITAVDVKVYWFISVF
jgi:hypothetical protein